MKLEMKLLKLLGRADSLMTMYMSLHSLSYAWMIFPEQ